MNVGNRMCYKLQSHLVDLYLIKQRTFNVSFSIESFVSESMLIWPRFYSSDLIINDTIKQ